MRVLDFVSQYKKNCFMTVEGSLSEDEKVAKIQALKSDLLSDISYDFPETEHLTVVFKQETTPRSSVLSEVAIIAKVFRSNVSFSTSNSK